MAELGTEYIAKTFGLLMLRGLSVELAKIFASALVNVFNDSFLGAECENILNTFFNVDESVIYKIGAMSLKLGK